MAKEQNKIGCLGIVGVVLLVGFVGSLFDNGSDEIKSESASVKAQETDDTQGLEPEVLPLPAPPLSLLDAIQLSEEELKKLAGQVCRPLETMIEESTLIESTAVRTDRLALLKDAYDASEFVVNNPWVSSISQDTALGDVEALLEQQFKDLLSSSRHEGVNELNKNYPSDYRGFLEEFRVEVLGSCNLADRLASLEGLKKQATRIEVLAANVPWYPKGFSIYQGGTLAWKWADRSCSYYSAVCWHMDVVSKVGCTNLYAEINIEDRGGNLVDWSNDTARGMKPGQVAKLEFVSFTDGARTGSVSELSCY